MVTLDGTDGGVRDVFVFQQHSLQLRRRDLKALDFDELLFAIDNPMPAILISGRNITSLEETLGVEAVSRSLFTSPIAHAYIRSTNIDLTSLLRSNFVAIVINELYFAVRVHISNRARAIIHTARDMH